MRACVCLNVICTFRSNTDLDREKGKEREGGEESEEGRRREPRREKTRRKVFKRLDI
jgi:hypothetical protein